MKCGRKWAALGLMWVMACAGTLEEEEASLDALSSELTFKALDDGRCELTTRRAQAARTIDTRGDATERRATFVIPKVPAGVTRATLRFRGVSLDRARGEGTLRVNGGTAQALPTRRDRERAVYDMDVTTDLRPGRNEFALRAARAKRGVTFTISRVRLLVEDVACQAPGPTPTHPPVAQPPTTGAFRQHQTPMGISAFAALAPDFPRRKLWKILGRLERPYTSLLLDFGPVYDRHNLQMFGRGPVGQRPVNPAHLDAVRGFLEAYIQNSPRAARRHLQLYVLNGPGTRRVGYPRAFPQDPRGIDQALQQGAGVRADLARYYAALWGTVAPFLDRVDVRLVPGLEDNYTRAGARAARRLARDAGWTTPIGRNPCDCGHGGDTARVGDFHEEHPHGAPAVRALPGGLQAGDVFSNDGWGYTAQGPQGSYVGSQDVVNMVRKSERTGLWFLLWYDPIQGYPIPANGPRDLRFDHTPGSLGDLFAQGLGQDGAQGSGSQGATGRGRERTMGYREARFEGRHNWVLDCRDYAYSARGDEHKACDGGYRPDGTTKGRAIFTFRGVTPDRYEVLVEGRNTENRNPAGTKVIVAGRAKRLNQRNDRGYVFVRHGSYDLAGDVEVIIDSTGESGSDSVRRVRLKPVR